MLNFERFGTAGNAVAAGVYIPVSDLWNVSAGELTGADAESRVIAGLLEVMANPTAPLALIADKLGFSSTYPNPTGAGTNIINQVATMTVNYVVDLSDNTVSTIPAPVSGVGEISITDIFPNAVLVAAAGAVAGAGIVIPTALLQDYGSPAQGALNVANDSRAWLNALVLYMADNAAIRSATEASAVIAANATLAVAGALPSAAQIAASALLADNNVTQLVVTRGVSITVQKVIDTATETVSPRHVIA